MSVPRFKVWTIDPDGQPGTLLLRTGADRDVKNSDFYDVGFAGLTAEDVAFNACYSTGYEGWVLVKNFDVDESVAWTVVGVSSPIAARARLIDELGREGH